jgi:hypothetical protein
MAEVDSPLLCGGVHHARTFRCRVRRPPPCDLADSFEDARCRCRSGRSRYRCLRLQLLDPLSARMSHFVALAAQGTLADAGPGESLMLTERRDSLPSREADARRRSTPLPRPDQGMDAEVGALLGLAGRLVVVDSLENGFGGMWLAISSSCAASRSD